MLVRDVSLLRCPRCPGRLALVRPAEQDSPLSEGSLRCARCGARYPVKGGVPRFVSSRGLDAATRRSQASFSAKWKKAPDYGTDSEATRRLQHEWYLRRYGFRSEQRLKRFLSDKKLVLDVGTGLGRDTFRYAALSKARVFGVDFSSSVDEARKRVRDPARVTFVQGDALSLPFASGAFDFVACDQLLPNVSDQLRALRELRRVTAPGGHLAFYVYRRRGPMREFANDYLRERIGKMSPSRAWRECEAITELGKALSDLRATVELRHPIPLLGIEAGRHDVQRLLFYNFLKCFWNDSLTFDENNLVNYDWYHPPFTFRQTEEEVRSWLRDLGLRTVHLDRHEPSGISVLCRTPGARARLTPGRTARRRRP